MRISSGVVPARLDVCPPGSGSLDRAVGRFPDVLDRFDADRVPQGGRSGSVDRQRRPRVPRTVRVPARGDRRAVPVDGRRGAGRHAVGRLGQRGQGAARRPRRQDDDVLRRQRAGGARDGAGAERRALRRDLARRQDLSGRRRRNVEDVLRSRRQVHLGAGRRSRRRRLRGDGRQGCHLQDHSRTAPVPASTRRTPPTSSRSQSRRRAS